MAPIGAGEVGRQPVSLVRLSRRIVLLVVIGGGIVMAQIKVPIMNHQAESHAVEPSGLSQHVSRHCGTFSEIDSRFNLDTEHSQSNPVRICEKAGLQAVA